MANEIEKNNNIINPVEVEQTYHSVRWYVVEAQKQIYRSVNSAMVEAYWKIGKEIYEVCGENERAAYGKQILAELSERLTVEFGKGFTEANLRNMRQFYLTFPKRDALRSELSWTHYRQLMRVPDTNAREFYLEEAAKAGWSSRQLQRQIHTMYYERILASKDKSDTLVEYTLPENDQQIYASKYLPYLPTEEELKRELRIADFEKVEE